MILTAEALLFQFALWHTKFLMNPKTIRFLAVTLNLDSKCGTKDRHWCKQKCGVQFLNLPADLDDLGRCTPRVPTVREKSVKNEKFEILEKVREKSGNFMTTTYHIFECSRSMCLKDL